VRVNKIATILALTICLAASVPGINAAEEKGVANAEELVARHLDSIANAKARADLKSHVAQGPVQFKILVGGAGILDGKAVFVSQGDKLQFMMKLLNNEYRGEQFVFDGQKDKVAFATARQTRSTLGAFMFAQDAVIREGLLGGVLSTAWPLLNLDERKAKLTFEGVKKVDGQELYEMRYHPKKNSDLEIHLYFDPETYHHVETTYSYSIQAGMANLGPSSDNGFPTPGSMDNPGGTGPGVSSEVFTARQQQTRYRLQEKFSDFKIVDGFTLPTHYDVQFTQELQSGRTTVSDWDMKDLEVGSNVSLDPRNFEVK